MFGVISKILGGGQVLEKGIDLIDSFHTSEPEEIAAKTKAKVDLMKAYAPFKLAQRFIGLMFTAVFLGCFILVLVMTLTGEGQSDDVIAVMGQFKIGYIMLTIVAFYFGGGAFEGYQAAKAEREKK